MPFHQPQGPMVTVAARCSDALRALFGEFAKQVAELDPFPHDRAVRLPAPVLHLVALALIRKRRDAAEGCLASGDIRQHLNSIYDRPVPQARAIFRRLPLTSLGQADYMRFDELLACKAARATLAHGETIDSARIEVLNWLPAALRQPRIVRHIKSARAAHAVAHVYDKLASGPDDQAVHAFAEQLNATRSQQAFWECVKTQLVDHLPPFAPPLNFGDHRFRAITTPRSLLVTAQHFENCLADFLGDALSGQMGFYLWSNGVHRAVIAVRPMIGTPGIIHEIQGPRNSNLPDEVMSQILAPMERAGFMRSNAFRRRTVALRRIEDFIKQQANQTMQCEAHDRGLDFAELLAAFQ